MRCNWNILRRGKLVVKYDFEVIMVYVRFGYFGDLDGSTF